MPEEPHYEYLEISNYQEFCKFMRPRNSEILAKFYSKGVRLFRIYP